MTGKSNTNTQTIGTWCWLLLNVAEHVGPPRVFNPFYYETHDPVRTGGLAMGEHYNTIAFRVHCGTICGAQSTAVTIFFRSTIQTVVLMLTFFNFLLKKKKLCVNLQSVFLFWIACDAPSIKVDTAEQQVARHNQPNIYIHNKQTTKYSNIQDIGRNFQYYLLY